MGSLLFRSIQLVLLTLALERKSAAASCAAVPPAVSSNTSLTAAVRPGTNDWWNSSSEAYPATSKTAEAAHAQRMPCLPARTPRKISKLKMKYSVKCAHLRMTWCIDARAAGEACGKSQCSAGMIKRLVFSDVKAPVENPEITAAQSSAGHHSRSHFNFSSYSSR